MNISVLLLPGVSDQEVLWSSRWDDWRDRAGVDCAVFPRQPNIGDVRVFWFRGWLQCVAMCLWTNVFIV